MKMKKGFRTSLAAFLLMSTVLVSGCGCKKTDTSFKLNLEVWGFADDQTDYSEIFDNYRKINKNIVGITYRKLQADTYRSDLIEAMASGKGPDIFLIHNDWLPGFQDKIVAAPSDASIMNEQRYRENMADVAISDFVSSGAIWAAPLSVDSLGLYYNKDLFNKAGITSPPKTWDEFMEDVKLLTKVDSDGNILQSGVALGTAYNINRSTDILTMLMMQSGTQMSDEGMRATFGSSNGKSALDFYTQFANIKSPVYCWNQSNAVHYSIDSFAEGTAAMMFNYSWHIDTVRSKAPKLNFAVAKIPQFSDDSPVNYANYWALAVAANKEPSVPSGSAKVSNETRVKEAWKLITYMTMKPNGTAVAQSGSTSIGNVVNSGFDPASSYLNAVKAPAARRDLIESQKTDPDFGPFAWGNLIAKSWKQADPESYEGILADMINQVNTGQADSGTAIGSAQAKINKIVSK